MLAVKVHDILGDGMRQPRAATENGAGPPPLHPKGGGVFRSLAAEVAGLRGVKSHRREMVRRMIVGMGEAMSALEGGDEGPRILTIVLQRVRDGGDLEAEDDGYYSSGNDKGPVTAEMAAQGVGEAGCVVVADSIWNRLVPRDLLGVYEKAQRDRRSETNSQCTPRRRVPVDSMLESVRVDTGGLHLTSAPPTARIFLTYKNKLKCRAILDARQVNSSDPRKPPKFRLPALEGIRRWMGDAKRNTGGGGVSCVPRQTGFAECLLEHQTPRPCGGESSWLRGVRGESSVMHVSPLAGATAQLFASASSLQWCAECSPGGESGDGYT